MALALEPIEARLEEIRVVPIWPGSIESDSRIPLEFAHSLSRLANGQSYSRAGWVISSNGNRHGWFLSKRTRCGYAPGTSISIAASASR